MRHVLQAEFAPRARLPEMVPREDLQGTPVKGKEGPVILVDILTKPTTQSKASTAAGSSG